MPRVSSRFAIFALLAVTACQSQQQTATVLPDPPVYCYKTLARVACYPSPQQNVGTFVGTQQPVTVQKATTLEDGSVIVETVTPAYPPPSIPMPVHP